MAVSSVKDADECRLRAAAGNELAQKSKPRHYIGQLHIATTFCIQGISYSENMARTMLLVVGDTCLNRPKVA